MTTVTTNAQSVVIAKPGADVFAFMADSSKLDLWSFGTWTMTERTADGLVQGRSIFDGAAIYVRIQPTEERWLIDYWIGTDREQLQARIAARITSGTIAGLTNHSSILTLFAVRTVDMAEARWQRLVASHAFELQLIKSLLETGYDHRSKNF